MEMKILNILVISETRWPGCGKCITDECTLYYFENPKHENGVEILVSKEINKRVIDYVRISDRIIVVRVFDKLVKINIIQIHAPTANKDERTK